MLLDLLSRHAARLGLLLALGALPAALAGCDDPAGSGPAVAAVDVTAPDTRVAVGQALQLGVAVRDAAGAELTGRDVEWSSSNPGIASVSATGLVTGRVPGTVTIAATAGGKRGEVTVAVDPAAARVTLEPDSFLLAVGNSVAIQAPTGDHLANARARILAVPRDAAGGVMLGVPARFSTSSAAVATVSDSGVVRGVAPGVATIIVRAGGAEGRLTVTVERAYTLTYLGTLPGMPESAASGVNEQGQVVGTSGGGSTPGATRGWIWRNGTLTELTAPGKTDLSVAPGAINDRGQVGGIVSASDGLFVALWESDGRVMLAPAVGGVFGGMNERGEIVGSWRNGFCTRNCGGGAWIFRDGAVRVIGNQGYLRIQPEAVDDAGQIAGTAYTAQPGGIESTRAFVMASDSAPVTPLPTSATASQGHDISDRGVVVGQDHVDGYRAFAWTRGGAAVQLGRLAGGSIAVATDVNSAGTAIGRSDCAGCTAPLPVVFRGGSAIRVEDLSAPGDWVWETVTDINDRGQIVGFGKHRATGVRGALLLTPPAP